MRRSEPDENISPSPLRNSTILVVEDDSDTREMLKFVLQGTGAEVLATHAVTPALELYETAKPDVIVADIGMPELNGYALISKIRELDREKRAQTKCVAVTAYATDTDRQIALRSGYDAYLSKPFEPDELVKTVVALAT